jgi:hypothetical protein
VVVAVDPMDLQLGIQEARVVVEQMVVAEDQVMKEDFQKQKDLMAEIQARILPQELVVVEHLEWVVMYPDLLFQARLPHLVLEVLEHQTILQEPQLFMLVEVVVDLEQAVLYH